MAQKKLPIILDRKEIEKLLAQPSKNSRSGLRNLAIMKIMLNCGLRVSEVSKLRPAEIDLGSGKIRIVNGKGGKDRNLRAPDSILETLKNWRRVMPASDYFFPTLTGEQIGSRYLQHMVKRYAEKAHIQKNITPHSLRHWYATDYYRQTRDIYTLQKILGHESITTTTIYITLGSEEVEQGMNNFIGV